MERGGPPIFFASCAVVIPVHWWQAINAAQHKSRARNRFIQQPPEFLRVYVACIAASSRSLLISKHITTILNSWHRALARVCDYMETPEEQVVEERKPTSLLVAQFFLFPLIIIAICVGIFLLFGYLTFEQRSPREYLKSIQNGSESQRWQAAYELSNQVFSDKEKLDEKFVGDMI